MVIFSGRLFNNEECPISNQRIYLYGQDDQFLLKFRTTSDGYFTFDLPSAQSSIIFRLYQNNKTLEIKYYIPADINASPYTTTPFDIGSLYFLYPNSEENAPLSYLLDIGITAVGTGLMKGIHMLKRKLFGGSYTTADIQRDYGFGMVELTHENTFGLLTNGICPIYFKRGTNNQLIAEVIWDKYNLDKLYSLPNVKVCFENNTTINYIQLEYRKTLYSSNDKEDIRIYYPNSDNFDIGLRAANSAFTLYGEAVFHLGMGHIYGAKYAQYVYDYLRHTCLGDLLLPHCHLIRKITFNIGDKFITGEEGVINISALNINGIDELLSDTISTINPFVYKPREPLWEGHYFAKAQKLGYNIIRRTVREYLLKHRDRIISEWRSIHQFYHKRHRSSPIYRELEDLPQYVDVNEISGSGRRNVPSQTKYYETDGNVRTIPWICKNSDGPEENDLYWIELDISHYIFMVTVYHSWIHRAQHYNGAGSPPITDLNFSPITINNYGEGINGGITMEEADQQEFILKILSDFPSKKYSLVKSKQVIPELVLNFREAADEFLNCKINVNSEIQVGCVI